VLFHSRVAEGVLLLVVVLVQPEAVLWEGGVRDVGESRVIDVLPDPRGALLDDISGRGRSRGARSILFKEMVDIVPGVRHC